MKFWPTHRSTRVRDAGHEDTVTQNTSCFISLVQEPCRCIAHVPPLPAAAPSCCARWRCLAKLCRSDCPQR